MVEEGSSNPFVLYNAEVPRNPSCIFCKNWVLTGV